MWKRNKSVWRVIRNGYIRRRFISHPFADKEGFVLEHRLVLESHLGRLLDNSESVHHKNNNRSDNRIENLELCVNQREHNLKHRWVYNKSVKQNFNDHICGVIDAFEMFNFPQLL